MNNKIKFRLKNFKNRQKVIVCLFLVVILATIGSMNAVLFHHSKSTNQQTLGLYFDNELKYEGQFNIKKINRQITKTIETFEFETLATKKVFSTRIQANSHIEGNYITGKRAMRKIQQCKKIAKNYLHENIENSELPTYDNIDDYFDKKNTIQVDSLKNVDPKIKQHSKIYNEIFDGKQTFFDGEHFFKFDNWNNWKLKIFEIIEIINNAFQSCIIVTATTAVITAATLLASCVFSFISWAASVQIGVLAIDYLLCTLALWNALNLFRKLPIDMHNWTLQFCFESEPQLMRPIVSWLQAIFKICEELIEINKNFFWMDILTKVTKQFYTFLSIK